MKAPFALLAIAAAGLGLAANPSHAQAAPPADAMPITDDMPLADYLSLLAQISPAAHDGAQAYRQAVQQPCGRREHPPREDPNRVRRAVRKQRAGDGAHCRLFLRKTPNPRSV